MGKARSMARKKKHDGALMNRSMARDDALNRIKTCENRDVGPWSDLNHDVLYLVMMQLGVIDFLAFSRVCKSWRSFALSNRNSFMVSKPPMSISISSDSNQKEYRLYDFGEKKYKTILPDSSGVCKSCRPLALYNTNRFMLSREPMCVCLSTTNERECYLEDFEGRKFKTILPHSGGSICIGLSCGYLILFHEKTRDFWLVNPITSHEFHFPDFPFEAFSGPVGVGAILLFSPIICRWVFVVFSRYDKKIWFRIAGKQKWTCLPAPKDIRAIHAYKGKIYILDDGSSSRIRICEMRLYQKPEIEYLGLMIIDFSYPKYVSSGETLYVLDLSSYPNNIKELNFSKMKKTHTRGITILDFSYPESCEKTGEKYAFVCNAAHYGRGTLAESWADLHSLYERYTRIHETGIGRVFYADMWYSFHDCLNVNLPYK